MLGFIKRLFVNPEKEERRKREIEVLSQFNGKIFKGKYIWFIENKRVIVGSDEFSINDVIIGQDKVFIRGSRIINDNGYTYTIENMSLTIPLTH